MRPALLTLLLCAPMLAQPASPEADLFAPVRFLVGEWKGEGDGRPGQSTGGATFRFELEGKILVRRSVADSVARGGKPAFHHEDLMMVYAEAGELKALYLDNENHVIRYRVTSLSDGAVFTSEPGPGPRFRLTYRRRAESLVSVRFEFAPPGKSEAFSTYLEAAMRKAP